MELSKNTLDNFLILLFKYNIDNLIIKIIFYNNLRLKHWTFYQKGDFIQRKIH